MRINFNCCHRADCRDTHCPGRPHGARRRARRVTVHVSRGVGAVSIALMCSIGGLSGGWLLAMALDAAGIR